MRRQEFACQDMIYSMKLATFVWLKVQLNSSGSMSPHRMAWQKADPQSPAHRQKPSCCSWHRQVGSTAWSLGRLLPTFVMHKGNAWVYHKQGKPEGTVHAQQAKYNSLCKNWNIEQKPSGSDRRSITCEKCKGKRSAQKMALLSENVLLVLQERGCVFSFCLFSFTALLLQPDLPVLPVALVLDATKERKASKKLWSCESVDDMETQENPEALGMSHFRNYFSCSLPVGQHFAVAGGLLSGPQCSSSQAQSSSVFRQPRYICEAIKCSYLQSSCKSVICSST